MEEQRGIDIFSFVNKYLGENAVKGKEITVKICPFCGRKHKFSINYEKNVFQCFSGNCREKGSIGDLYKKYGLIDYASYNPKPMTDILQYVKATTQEAIDFLKLEV